MYQVGCRFGLRIIRSMPHNEFKDMDNPNNKQDSCFNQRSNSIILFSLNYSFFFLQIFHNFILHSMYNIILKDYMSFKLRFKF